MNGSKASDSGAAKDTEENSFGLIVEGVSGRDFRSTLIARKLAKEIVTQLACSCFEVGFRICRSGFCGRLAEMAFKRMTLGKIGDEALIVVGVGSAEPVIDVGDGEDESDFRAEFEKETKQGDGIGTSGDGSGDAVSGAKEAMAANGLQ